MGLVNFVAVLVEGFSVMTKLAIVFAVAVAALALIASTTLGRVQRQISAAQLAPLPMMTNQHVSPMQMTDFSVVFDSNETK